MNEQIEAWMEAHGITAEDLDFIIVHEPFPQELLEAVNE